MSEQEAKPEVLPGDLISGPGVYISRSNCAVEVRGYDHGCWKAEWEDGARWYHSSGQQTGSLVWDDPYQLVRWVGPLAEDIPTTSEQIAEIEAQAADYTPPEGWRLLQPGEALQPGDAWHDPQADLFEADLNLTGVAGSHGYYLRRQVCEGRWCTRGGEIRNVTRTPDEHDLVDQFPWWDGSFRNTWRDDGRYTHERQSAFDLLGYLGPIESEPEPEPQLEPEPQPEPEPELEDCGFEGHILREQPQPVQIRKVRWRTRGGEVRAITYPWHDARCDQTWLSSGRYHTVHTESPLDLWEYLGPITPEPQAEPEPQPEPEPQQAPQAESDAEIRVKLLKHANNTQAETIGRLQDEIRDLRTELAVATQKRDAHVSRIGHLETINHTLAETIAQSNSEMHALNMEIGGLNRERAQKDDRIGYLETMNSGQAAAVRAAGEQNTQLRELADRARQQLEAAADEISELRQSLDASEKQLDQKDAQIRNLRIELDAAQQVVQPLNDEQRELIWNEATKFAGQQVVEWLQPLVHALKQQPNERFLSFMALTLAALPDIVPRVLGYEEEQAEDAEE